MHPSVPPNDPRCENRISGHSDGHACMHVAMLYMRARAPCLFWARGAQFGAKPPGSLGGTMGHLLRNQRARGALFWLRHGRPCSTQTRHSQFWRCRKPGQLPETRDDCVRVGLLALWGAYGPAMPPMLASVLEVKTIVDLTPLFFRCGRLQKMLGGGGGAM